MPFTSFEFAVFFGVVLTLNWRLKAAGAVIYRPFILAANLIFYAFAAPEFIPVLLVVAFSNWGTAVAMRRETRQARRKLYLGLNVALCLALLVFFKYFEFVYTLLEDLGLASILDGRLALPEILYPVGLSFFTFQGLSLAIDHYRRPDLTPPSFMDALIFVSFFPTILSGPIQRADRFLPQLDQNKYDPANFNLAVVLIISGLFKKVALSSYLSDEIVRGVFQVPEAYSALGVWCGIYAYSAQIYLDFSGYSDLALGVGLLLGYNVGINFNAPYLATNIRDFWRRWHISLSTWLRDYLYISLGGNRRGNKYLNLFITQTLGGLWHGAHLRYLIWGIGHGLALVVSHLFEAKREARQKKLSQTPQGAVLPNPKNTWLAKAFGFFITINFVSLMWILFRAEDATRAGEIIKAAFDFNRFGAGGPLIAWLIIILAVVMQLTGDRVKKMMVSLQNRLSAPFLVIWCALFVIAILKLGPDGVLPFIYFQY